MNPAHSEDTLEQSRDGCPCLLVEPCSYACSCAKPVMSDGCLRCCKYGSEEQRLNAAQILSQNYISKDRVIKAIGEDEDELLSTVVVERAPISRNQLRAEIRKELEL